MLKIVIGIVIFNVGIFLGFLWGYKHGEKDAYLEFVEKEEYYNWLLETKKRKEFDL